MCTPCISEEGQCLNHAYTDPWRLVKLIPQKGASMKKYEKRICPDSGTRQQTQEEEQEEEQEECSSDEELPNIVFNHVSRIRQKKQQESAQRCKGTEDKHWNDVAEEITEADFQSSSSSCSPKNEAELINLCEETSEEVRMSSDNLVMSDPCEKEAVIPRQLSIEDDDIPDYVYWHSILSGFQSCEDFHQVVNFVLEIKARGIQRLSNRVEAYFIEGVDILDMVAQAEIPKDGPVMLKAIWTDGDGNCLCRAIAKAFFNDDSRHIEIRAYIVIEGVLNMEKYLTEECLECGASVLHRNVDLPLVFATFSNYYMLGQRLTEDTTLQHGNLLL